MPSDVETYLAHFDALAGREPEFYPMTEKGEWPPLHVMVYRNTPEEGHITALTYGLSLVPHETWTHARPELMICMKSDDPRWAFAVGDVAYKLRGKCPFRYLEVIRFGTAVSDESEMSAFVVFAPPTVSQDEATVQLAEYKVAVVHMYPVYEGELALLDEQGPEWFFSRPGSFFLDPKRPDLSKQP